MNWDSFRARCYGLTPRGVYDAFMELEPWEQERLVTDRAEDTNGHKRVEVETYPAGTRIKAYPEAIPVWGVGNSILWAEGEATWIVGRAGLGKSFLACQLALSRAGIGPEKLLGYDITTDPRRVLYVAADRPKQLYRLMSRMIPENAWDNLDRAMEFAEDVPVPLSADPDAFLEWIEEKGDIGTVVIDSLKDVATGLSDDEAGNTVNLALKAVIHSGREVLVLHHNRKLEIQGQKRKPTEDDVYGSRWLAAGAGSIFFLTGEPGNAHVEFVHVKSPVNNLGTLALWHQFVEGRTELDQTSF